MDFFFQGRAAVAWLAQQGWAFVNHETVWFDKKKQQVKDCLVVLKTVFVLFRLFRLVLRFNQTASDFIKQSEIKRWGTVTAPKKKKKK